MSAGLSPVEGWLGSKAQHRLATAWRSRELRDRPGQGERELQREAARLGLAYEVSPPMLRWYPDLVFPGVNLIVEVDGRYHWGAAQQRKDAVKDRALSKAGWRVVRVWAEDAVKRPAEVLAGAFVMGLGIGHDGLARCRAKATPAPRVRKPKKPKRHPPPKPVPVYERGRSEILRVV